MMSFQSDCFAEADNTRDEQIKSDFNTNLYLDGATDAAFCQLPQYTDPSYLEGYCNKLKELPKDPVTGKILHYSPHQNFAFGYIDGAEKFCTCNDDF